MKPETLLWLPPKYAYMLALIVRCTCREAVRFPDERSEELSRSERRKRVRTKPNDEIE